MRFSGELIMSFTFGIRREDKNKWERRVPLIPNHVQELKEKYDVDVIVPVPIHPSRKRHRGYNQSDWIGMGMSESLDIPLDTKNFYRNVATETQTKKSRFERWKNVENVFKVKSENIFLNKHILLIDDVLTTGATLEACANSLLKTDGVKVSIATLAVTQM